MKKFSFLIAVLLLTACGTVTVSDRSNNVKHIEYSNPPAISATPGGEFAIPQTHLEMEAMANKECPGGYQVIKQGLRVDKKAFFWDVKCSI